MLKGQAVVTRNESLIKRIGQLEKGEIFGEMAYILNLPRTSNVLVKSGYAIALKMDGKMIKALDPSVVKKFRDPFLVLLARRLDGANSQIII